jgi:sugar O-acyltransferase (sialic acid O-acetyltransferase NeuD family)
MANRTWTIFGAGNLIGDFFDAIESREELAEYVVLNMELDETILGRIPASTRIIKLAEFKPSTDYYFFGFIDPEKKPFLESLGKYHLTYSNLVHQFSYISKSVRIGQGNYIGPGVVLASNVELGNFNYLNRMASIGHDTKAFDFNEFSPACTVAGCCCIGNRNHFYSGSVIIDNLCIGDDITIGAGGVVIKDIAEPGTYAGVPVRKLN